MNRNKKLNNKVKDKKINNKEASMKETLIVLLCIVFLALIWMVIDAKIRPEFDEKLAGKEATVISEVANIYDDASGRNIGTVTQSQTVELTGKIAYQIQDYVKMQIYLEDNIVWICKKDIAISD